jgi:Ser/Thr protein kinase RdoA (MazF antagonist)
MIELLPAWLQHHYHWPAPPQISLLRSYTNDVYRVETTEGKYVLKVYGANWRSEEEIRYELELLEHLHRQGLAVARPITRTDEDPLKRVSTPTGQRYAVLYEFAAGEKPAAPFSPALYFLFGETIARMHEGSTNFVSNRARKNIDLEYLVDRPLQVVLPWLTDQPRADAELKRVAVRLKHKINQLSQRGLDWGPIHGDATLDNMHITQDQQIILYDFDSGGPGWRASDLQGWAKGRAEYQEKYAAFLDGYREVRAVNDQDMEASWVLNLAWDFWGMQIDLENRVLKLGRAATVQYITGQVDHIRDKEKLLID